MRVLLVDDDLGLTELLVRGLRRRGFAVDAAADGQAALDRAAYTPYDVVVLDRDLPVVHGDEVCRRLDRAGRSTKVLMLTASSDLADRVEGLEVLMTAAVGMVSAEELLEQVWDEHANPFTTSVKVTIHRLRRKLGEPGVIETVERAGSRMS